MRSFNKFMMTSSNGNIFRVTGHLCGEFTGPRWIPRTKASDAELWCFTDLRLNKRLSKQSWGWWSETLSCPSWRHRTDIGLADKVLFIMSLKSRCLREIMGLFCGCGVCLYLLRLPIWHRGNNSTVPVSVNKPWIIAKIDTWMRKYGVNKPLFCDMIVWNKKWVIEVSIGY